MTQQPELAPDGRIGIIGISFAGGLSIVAAGRPSIRDKLAYVLSFGGHADMPRVMRYLATGEEVHVPGVENHPPHDYGVAVILYGLADQGIVPAEQIAPLRKGVETFLYASQLTLVDMNQANATFEKARQYAKTLPEPAATYMTYVNDRNVAKLGPALVPYLAALGADSPTLSADRAPAADGAGVSAARLGGHGDPGRRVRAAWRTISGRKARRAPAAERSDHACGDRSRGRGDRNHEARLLLG